MYKKLFIPLLSSATGFFIGKSWNSYKECGERELSTNVECADKNSPHWRNYLNIHNIEDCVKKLAIAVNKNLSSPLHKVQAAAKIPVTNFPESSNSSQISNISTGNSRVNELARFGFPSLENIRVFDDFVLSYDRRNRTARWVLEHLTHERVKYQEDTNRTECNFQEDSTVHSYFRATNNDYMKSGYDRGHLAASANHRWSQSAMAQTFTLSNIAPQVGIGFNRGIWNKLEKYVRHLTKRYKNVYVCTGPLYLPRQECDGKFYVKYEVIGRNHVAVPTHFFKVVAAEIQTNEFELRSFVLPNQPIGDDVSLERFIVPLDSIERSSGLIFLDKYPRNSLKLLQGGTQ